MRGIRPPSSGSARLRVCPDTSVTNAVKLKLAAGTTGWQWARIIISRELDNSMRELASKDIIVRRAALFSALVTDEVNGRARASMAVVQAGETANKRLKYGVTPLFSPDKQQINAMLKRHRMWVHSGHGHHTNGISILKKGGNTYSHAILKASDITDGGLDYDLVFMNTCESTDQKYFTIQPVLPQAFGGWDGPYAYTDGTAVLDIGLKLNAKNYVGWDCEVVRQFSVGIPKMLMQELDSTGTRPEDRRTVADAVQAVWDKLQNENPRRNYWYFGVRLNAYRTDGTIFDLNERPF